MIWAYAGLPDLYNTSAIAGHLSSEDGSSWIKVRMMALRPGRNQPRAYVRLDKITLGWANPTIASSRQNVALSNVETNPSMLKVPVQNGLPREYFLVEYRSRSAPGHPLTATSRVTVF